jgi:hypothetical protein
MNHSNLLRTQSGLIAAQLRSIDFANPSVLSLMIANVVPLFGVIFLGWSTFAIVAIYWSENVIIGMINVLKMAVCSPLAEDVDLTVFDDAAIRDKVEAKLTEYANQRAIVSKAHHASKLFLIPFFTVHYGLFCFVHGVFVFELLGNGFGAFSPLDFWGSAFERLKQEHLQWAVAALAASHLFSFFINFLHRGEYRHVSAPQLMAQPYGRIVVLHIAILFGAFAIVALGSPVWMLVILIICKTIFDIGLHQAERVKNAVNRHTEWAKQINTEFAK